MSKNNQLTNSNKNPLSIIFLEKNPPSIIDFLWILNSQLDCRNSLTFSDDQTRIVLLHPKLRNWVFPSHRR
ncbi:unnamed protein product [Citrullus colocynthis]|uniref:Uncharacterized protein n=1 Tax=Citrullus colocynthis TaxID=252529 RepID=A0ABP0XVE4_9ROSI